MKQILLGVTGGIAAYKAAEVLRLLKKAGHSVRVVMTQHATEFVGPMTFQALSGTTVYAGNQLASGRHDAMAHIELAKWADEILIAPATASAMAHLVMGDTPDLLYTTVLACEGPLTIVPSMNRAMWHHPATQANLKMLIDRGVNVLLPDVGEQACGDHGLGRMVMPEQVVEAVAPSKPALKGLHICVTAGPTREYLDPVRYMSNPSSGKMGYAMAQACLRLGAKVTLIAGPNQLQTPLGANLISVVSAEEMFRAVESQIDSIDILIGAAAVSDHKPTTSSTEKTQKHLMSEPTEWALNPDIVKTFAERVWTVGFAAQTHDVLRYAQSKFRDKGVRMLIANDVGQPNIGFQSDDNAVHIITEDEIISLPQQPKAQLSMRIAEMMVNLYHKEHQQEDTHVQYSA